MVGREEGMNEFISMVVIVFMGIAGFFLGRSYERNKKNYEPIGIVRVYGETVEEPVYSQGYIAMLNAEIRKLEKRNRELEKALEYHKILLS